MPPQEDENRREDDNPDDDTFMIENSAIHHTDQIQNIDPIIYDDAIIPRRQSFVEEFTKSKGPPQIIILCILLALGFGSTIGVVPAVMTDRYARLNHGYNSTMECSSYHVKPVECLAGSADAQNAVAIEQMVSNTLTFFTSSLIGSLSDEYGRKPLMLIGIFLWSLSPLCLLLIQLYPNMSPFWYYGVGAVNGIVSWITVALSSLSDVMPPKWRAPSFGFVLAGFSLGFALAPQLALLLGHLYVSVLSLTTVLLGLLVVMLFFPETLSEETALDARITREERVEGMTDTEKIKWMFYRPIWELSILNRNSLFRLLSCLAFFSGMVSSGDQTLLLYYVEERLGFTDKDIATMFLLIGVLGIVIQGCALKAFNDFLGERKVVMLSFSIGMIHNIIYGIANNKAMMFTGIAISSFVGMSFPTISAIKANNAEKSEQGRIQGALYSLSALASAFGPMSMRFVYHYTKDGAFLGPGSMFIMAAGLYSVAIYCGYKLPVEADSSTRRDEQQTMEQHDDSINTPLV